MSTRRYNVRYADGKGAVVLDMNDDPPEEVMRGIRERHTDPGYVLSITQEGVDPLAWTEAELDALEPAWLEGDPDPPYRITEAHVGDPVVRSGYLGKAQGFWLHLLVPARQFAAYDESQRQAMRARLDSEMLARCH